MGARGRESGFVYLLNAMEVAATAENPADFGYGKKRRAVLDYVAELERERDSLRNAIDQARAALAQEGR